MTAEFDSFCRDEYASVFRATYVFTGNREMALDATQEAFARAFARWRRLRKHDWAGGWVMTTAMNLCRGMLKERPRPSDEPRSVSGIDVDERVDLIAAVQRLPPRQRQALLLYYFADLPITAVAHLMKTSDGTVKSHLSRARRALGRDVVVKASEVTR